MRLEAIGKDLGHVVPDHVFGFRSDGRIGFKIRLTGSMAQYLQSLVKVVIAEHILKIRVNRFCIVNFGVMRAPFINDGECNFVFDCLPHCVLIYVVTEDLFGLINGCSRVADLRRMG